ncbi:MULTISPECIES: HD domain-containing protein [unclassified Saccharicrinis]|uniref:HD domain-containing protein n=1 Tax=unclassified Saccharicrinis TaxID=2646859 RepID=UPI003D33B913
MNELQSSILKKIESYVSDKMNSVDAGHDMRHIYRVLKNAQKINETEQGDGFLIKAGVLLHDITDEKLFDKNQAEIDLEIFLEKIGLGEPLIKNIFKIINAVSFGSEIDGSGDLTLEQKVVRDADRLDAMGAIGIARTFHYGGSKNREIFNPDFPPQTYRTTQEYRKSVSPTINHFYEKLLLLKNKMETNTGRQRAEERHNYMVGFLRQFYKEMDEEGFSLDGNN